MTVFRKMDVHACVRINKVSVFIVHLYMDFVFENNHTIMSVLYVYIIVLISYEVNL